MWLGLLIGLTLFGLAVILSNPDRGSYDSDRLEKSKARILGFFFFLIGLCGAIGWITEINLS